VFVTIDLSDLRDHQHHVHDHGLTHRQLLHVQLIFYLQRLSFYQPWGGLNQLKYDLREHQLHQHEIDYLRYLVKE